MLLNIIISNTGDKPIYQQIADQIKDHIMKGLLEESEPLPSIRSLARSEHQRNYYQTGL